MNGRKLLKLPIIALAGFLFFACDYNEIDKASVDLSGEWKYKYGDNDEWANAGISDEEWQSINIPGDLVNKVGDHGIQSAWLRRNYSIHQDFVLPQALILGPVGDVDEVFIDGKLIGFTGQSRPTSPAFHISRVYLLPKSAYAVGTHTIAIRITKWGGPGFGLMYPPQIGDYNIGAVHASMYQSIRTDFPFSLGILMLFLGIFLLVVYARSRVELQYWYCATLCMIVGTYSMVDSWKADLLGFFPTEIYKLSGILAALSAHFTLRFVRTASRKSLDFLDRLSFVFVCAFSVWCLASKDATDMNLNLSVWGIYFIAVFSYVIRQFYFNMNVARDVPSRVLFGSFLFFGFTIVHDIYTTLVAPLGIYIVCYGYFTFCIGLAYFLAQNYSGALADRSETIRLKETAKNLEAAIQNDALTGLLTRQSFFTACEAEISKSKAEGKAFCLAIMDIDHFKFYNDSYGHPAGDRLLSKFGWIVIQRTRKSDFCGRVGGEEFAIAFSATSLSDAFNTCERLRENVESFLFENPGKNGNTTVSIGLASLSHNASTVEELYALADKQLYKAKQKRNTIEPQAYAVPRISEIQRRRYA